MRLDPEVALARLDRLARLAYEDPQVLTDALGLLVFAAYAEPPEWMEFLVAMEQGDRWVVWDLLAELGLLDRPDRWAPPARTATP